ncbi:conserved hypothetical protein [Stigmatella aurantiaca DW4/3-1]|uniref:Uncharacterized protein n=1 Tax=Stigmatella aurantiaca (strain DW4/3-1) TaxID=378806 RepID=Q08N00_STIAD|nr:conserved hypothetical protein [Stigmatella aurantiaca DW4/3-1]
MHRVLHDGARQSRGQVRRPEHTVSVVARHGQPPVHDGDGLGGGQGARGRLELRCSVQRRAASQFPEEGDHAADLLQRGLLRGQRQGLAHLGHALLDDLHFLFQGLGGGEHHRVEAAQQGAGELVDAPVPVVRRGDDIEARVGLDLAGELRHGQRLLAEQGDEGVLHLARHARQLLDARELSFAHGAHHGAGHQGLLRRALGQQPRVVPAIAQGGLVRARRALHEQGRVPADGRGEVLAQPRLGGARHTVEQQGPVGGEGGHGDLHQPRVADVFGAHLETIRKLAAEQIEAHGPGGEPPALGLGPVIGPGERGQFSGVLLFSVLAQKGGGGHGVNSWWRMRRWETVCWKRWSAGCPWRRGEADSKGSEAASRHSKGRARAACRREPKSARARGLETSCARRAWSQALPSSTGHGAGVRARARSSEGRASSPWRMRRVRLARSARGRCPKTVMARDCARSGSSTLESRRGQKESRAAAQSEEAPSRSACAQPSERATPSSVFPAAATSWAGEAANQASQEEGGTHARSRTSQCACWPRPGGGLSNPSRSASASHREGNWMCSPERGSQRRTARARSIMRWVNAEPGSWASRPRATSRTPAERSFRPSSNRGSSSAESPCSKQARNRARCSAFS